MRMPAFYQLRGDRVDVDDAVGRVPEQDVDVTSPRNVHQREKMGAA